MIIVYGQDSVLPVIHLMRWKGVAAKCVETYLNGKILSEIIIFIVTNNYALSLQCFRMFFMYILMIFTYP